MVFSQRDALSSAVRKLSRVAVLKNDTDGKSCFLWFGSVRARNVVD